MKFIIILRPKDDQNDPNRYYLNTSESHEHWTMERSSGSVLDKVEVDERLTAILPFVHWNVTFEVIG